MSALNFLPNFTDLKDATLEVVNKGVDFLKDPVSVGVTAMQLGMSARKVGPVVSVAGKVGRLLGPAAAGAGVYFGAKEFYKAAIECADKNGFAAAPKY